MEGENNQISISEHGDIHSRKSKCAASTHSKKWLAIVGKCAREAQVRPYEHFMNVCAEEKSFRRKN